MSVLEHPEEEIVIFSPMQGTITMNGKPVSSAMVERFIKWKDETGEKDSVQTDDNGAFSLPLIKEKIRLSKFSEFVVAQEIRIFVNGQEYPVWAKAKRSKGLYDELGGVPVNLRCELSDELILVESDTGTLMTSCKWDSIDPER